jgi:hypothetical protein
VIVFYNGSHLQIHPSTIILRARPITAVQLNGSFKEVFLTSGNPMVPSCGYMASVRPLSVYHTTSSDLLIISRFYSGLWQECSLVRLVLFGLPYEIHAIASAPRSYKISWLCAKLGGPRWPTSISTSGTLTNKNFKTCCLLSSFSFRLSRIPVATYSPDCILHTIAEYRNLVIVRW